MDYVARVWAAGNGEEIHELKTLRGLMVESLSHMNSGKFSSAYNSPTKNDDFSSPAKKFNTYDFGKKNSWENESINYNDNWDTSSVKTKNTSGTKGFSGFKKFSLGSMVSVSLKSAVKSAIIKSVIKSPNNHAKFSHDSKYILT